MNKDRFGVYIKVLAHVLLWTIVLVVPLYLMLKGERTHLRDYVGFSLKVTVLATIFYANYLYLIDNYLFEKKILIFFSINIILLILLLAGQETLTNFIAPSKRRFNPPRTAQMMRTFFDYIFAFSMIGMSVAMKVTIRWYQDSINLEKAKSIQLEADLRNLRSQLNPHFLFNTLNNIYSLISIDAVKAQDAVHRLSGLLRYVLYENEDNFVPINKELEFTQSYIDLMRLRYGSKLELSVDIINKDSKNNIASLLFITLIENAFKHGMVKGGKSFINISILTTDNSVSCSIENSIDSANYKNMEDKTTGIGLSNLTKRLELLYTDNHKLLITQKKDSFSVDLKIKLNEVLS